MLSLLTVAHFGFLFFVVMFAYAIVGHLLFGSLMHEWSTLGASVFAVVKMAMFEHNLDAMQRAADPVIAAIYFSSFMFVIANLLLWMFLAIVMVRRIANRLSACLNADIHPSFVICRTPIRMCEYRFPRRPRRGKT